MILSKRGIQYFQKMQSNVLASNSKSTFSTPYTIEGDPFLSAYECIRMVWKGKISILSACRRFGLSKSQYYEMEAKFVNHGIVGLLSVPLPHQQYSDLEKIILLIKKSRPSLSYTAIYRFAESLPMTKG